MNETIEKTVVNYVLELWFVDSDSDQYYKTSTRFLAYMKALKDAEIITGGDWFDCDFLEIIKNDMKSKDIPGAVQHILDHLRRISK